MAAVARRTLDTLKPYDVLGIIVGMSAKPHVCARVCKAFNHVVVQSIAYNMLRAAYKRYPCLEAVANVKFNELKKALQRDPTDRLVVMAVYETIVMDDSFIATSVPHFSPLPCAPLGRLHPEWMIELAKPNSTLAVFEHVAQNDRQIDKAFRHLRKALTFAAPELRHCIQLARDVYLWMIGNSDLLSMRNLELDRKGLTEIPSCIGLFANVEELNVDGNFLTQVPVEIEECRKLEKFQADENAISDPHSIAPLFACRKLVELSLGANGVKLFPTIPPKRWARLEYIDLAGNLLSRFPEGIGNCTSLAELRLYNNRIACIPDELNKCTRLKVLSIAYNRLTVVNPVVGALTRLRTFRLDYNMIEVLPPEMSGCARLTKLDLSHNPLKMSRAAILSLVPLVNEAGLETSVTRALSLTASQQAQLSEPQDEEGTGAGSGSGSAEPASKRQRTEEKKSH